MRRITRGEQGIREQISTVGNQINEYHKERFHNVKSGHKENTGLARNKVNQLTDLYKQQRKLKMELNRIKREEGLKYTGKIRKLER